MTAPTTAKTTAAKKAQTKAAPAKPETTTETAAPETKTYEAGPARCGKVNRRQSSTVLTHAVDVKDEQHTNRSVRLGAVTKFFASAESAQRYADAQNAAGADAVVLTAKVVEA